MKISTLIIFFLKTINVWLVQLIRLYKVTELSYKITKLYKAIRLLYKVTKLWNMTNNKNLSTKLLWLYISRISHALKF